MVSERAALRTIDVADVGHRRLRCAMGISFLFDEIWAQRTFRKSITRLLKVIALLIVHVSQMSGTCLRVVRIEAQLRMDSLQSQSLPQDEQIGFGKKPQVAQFLDEAENRSVTFRDQPCCACELTLPLRTKGAAFIYIYIHNSFKYHSKVWKEGAENWLNVKKSLCRPKLTVYFLFRLQKLRD